MGIETTTLKFLKDLDKNNNREWFQSHKDLYEQTLVNVKNVAEEVKKMLRKKDQIEEAKVFRI